MNFKLSLGQVEVYVRDMPARDDLLAPDLCHCSASTPAGLDLCSSYETKHPSSPVAFHRPASLQTRAARLSARLSSVPCTSDCLSRVWRQLPFARAPEDHASGASISRLVIAALYIYVSRAHLVLAH